MGTEIATEDLNRRIEKLENQKTEEIFTLVEILSIATFFGDIRRKNCKYSKGGQCSLFVVRNEPSLSIPMVTRCHIKECPKKLPHSHIETSNVICTLCPIA